MAQRVLAEGKLTAGVNDLCALRGKANQVFACHCFHRLFRGITDADSGTFRILKGNQRPLGAIWHQPLIPVSEMQNLVSI